LLYFLLKLDPHIYNYLRIFLNDQLSTLFFDS
jgi:hypothetical protein